MASIQTRPATPADLNAITRIHYDALYTFHDFYGAFFIMHPRELMPRLNVRAMRNPGQIFRVATQDDQVVGFVRYQVVDAQGEIEGVDKSADVEEPIGPLVRAKSHVKGLWGRFSERDDVMDEVYKRASGGQRHYYVKHLMVDPTHQRKGIGGKLLAEVTALADKEGIATFIVSSAEAYDLYGRLGFEDLETFRIDNGYWAKEVVKIEKELGIKGNEGLAEKYEGVEEIERYMIRKART